MSDSLERLYQAVIAAKDLDPATSRTARLFQRGPSKMAKKLAEEAIEVVIDAVNGKTEAVVRESADLLYNLTVLWASAGVKPEDVWREMERREDLLGIAEKMPKSAVKLPKTKAIAARVLTSRCPSGASPRSGGELSRWKAAACASGTKSPQNLVIRRHGQIRSMMVHARHAETDLRLVHRRRRQALRALDSGCGVVRGKLVLSDPARYHAAADVAGAAEAGMVVRDRVHDRFRRGGVLGYAIGALLYDSLGQWLINLYGLSGKVETFRASYAEWGAVIIIGKGLTPIPYKLVTITSGFAGYNIWLFILCSIIARGGRFFVVAILLNRYGEWIRRELEKRLGTVGRDRRRRAGARFLHRVQADLHMERAGRKSLCADLPWLRATLRHML